MKNMQSVKKTLTTALIAGLALGGAAITAAPAQATENTTKTITWLVPNGVNPNTSGDIWPQTISSSDACGTGWFQVDTYRYATPEEKAAVDAFDDDGLLVQGEDDRYYLSHQFVQQTPCVVTPPPVVDTTPTPVVAPSLTVTPPTCDAAGSLPFLGNPAAQNPNGYEFPGLGYRVYISPAFAGAGIYTATVQKVGPGFDPAFPYGTKVSGQTSQTLVVLPATGVIQSTDASAPCYEAPPVVIEPPVVVAPPVVIPELPEEAPVPVVEVVVAPVVADDAEPEAERLASTGVDSADMGIIAAIALAALLVGGLFMLVVFRRR